MEEKCYFSQMDVGVRYETFVIGSDEGLQILLHYRRSFSEVRIPKLLAKLEDGVDSSGASSPNSQSTTVGGASTSMPVVAAAIMIPDPQRVTAVHAGVPPVVLDFEFEAGPDRVENAMQDNDSDDEPVTICGDSDDDIPSSTPTPHGAFGSGTQQYPPHLSSLNLEAIGQHQNEEIGQSFQSKEEVVLSVKDYNIRRGIEYRVMQSDHLKYQGICKEFGNGADASITIKVLQEATQATYGFRPSYNKVWLTKQKAVAQIYSDWEESYSDLPRWILGVTSTMDSSVALLKTSPVRVGDQVDESRGYFHRMFWTFPPCIEAFRHCKPLVSIGGTHLYDKYGGTLLLAISQDENSNILPVAFALVEEKNAKSWFSIHL
ncbi:uncharacterized protein LOC107475616 [Arachis duranensis]|uniref:Uncharacterized protein LOC107475616 n=1 Tax=Arachis duranensis TaxID=130453 RepID=A0A6P4CFU8_ARADU|nr:uncharacterized protein LOC107475616 [Arachis duranensis]